jgi:hypothetical protein
VELMPKVNFLFKYETDYVSKNYFGVIILYKLCNLYFL